jgi:L,D-peptidoglycan transpeptidase YkuD (ErfK/YbiS/YcfS/YnhG family)
MNDPVTRAHASWKASRVEKGDIPTMRKESTLYLKLRQKQDVFSTRGAAQISRASVRQLPRLPGRPPLGLVRIGSQALFCALGRNGVGVKRREGDSITPIGRFRITQWMRRPDRWTIFRADCRAISKADGWCDDPRSFSYNRAVRLPIAFSAETLWRDDGLYDILGVIDFNQRPRVIGRGSAIFMHIAQGGYPPTAGCIALAAKDFRKIQFRLRAAPQIVVGDIFTRRSPKIAEPTRTFVAPI